MMTPYRAALLATVIAVACSGCTTLTQRDDALASYEQTRRRLENQSNFRPVSETAVRADDQFVPNNLTPDNLTQTVRRATGQGPNRTRGERVFRDAEALRQQGMPNGQQAPTEQQRRQLASAAEKYLEAAKAWPESALEQDSLYLAGECYFFADRYPKAEEAYAGLLKKYENSKYLDQVQPRRFAIAQYWLELDRREPQSFYELNFSDSSRPRRASFTRAIAIFDRIRMDDPTGKLADDATLAAANAYFSKQKWLKADDYYTDLRKTFPSSEHQFQAHFLGLKSKLESYQGPDYSEVPLLGAQELLDQMRKQFPVDAQREQEYLAKAFAEISYLRAEKEWYLAQRHDRRREYGAARVYYEELLDEYSQTPFAAQAQTRLQSIASEPDVPDQTMEWLANLFPDVEEGEALIASDELPMRR